MNPAHKPLAEALRPQTLDDVVGQEHLLGPGKPLRMALMAQKPHSMIFWGPPGVGKTTLARLTAQSFECTFIALSAVFAGVKDIRSAIEQAEQHKAHGQHTLLFIDEIHRFNTAQQDALLPFVESGLITLIGATTENPSFEVNKALCSRVHIYVLKPLPANALNTLLEKACQSVPKPLQLDEPAKQMVLAYADGDARKLLNTIEQLSNAYDEIGEKSTQHIRILDAEWVRNALGSQLRRFDKAGDAFYDQISALHKSVRGSNPDAALYWLCRMLDGGADPNYLARRIVRIAWEDIGLADPRAQQVALDAASTYQQLGSPEGELALAQAVLYLAVAPKSDAGYVAFKKAKAFVAGDASQEVPMHLKNAPTKLMQQLGHGHAYRHPHDEPDGFAKGQGYLPHGMTAPNWYKPVERGLEIKIAEKMKQLKVWDAQATQTRDDSPNE